VNGLVFEIVPPVRDEDAIFRIKEKGRREWFELSLTGIYHFAVKRSLEKKGTVKRTLIE
jgi:hypothetical protein